MTRIESLATLAAEINISGKQGDIGRQKTMNRRDWPPIAKDYEFGILRALKEEEMVVTTQSRR